MTRYFVLNCEFGCAARARIASRGSLSLSAIECNVGAGFAPGGTDTITAWWFDARLGAGGGMGRVAGVMPSNINPARSCGVGPLYCTGSNEGRGFMAQRARPSSELMSADVQGCGR